MAHQRNGHPSRRRGVAVGVAALAILLAGCTTAPTGGSTSPGSSTASAPSDAATPTAVDANGPCVADPAAVVSSSLPPAAAGPMPAPLASALDAHVTEAMSQVAATAAVVAVQTPDGTWTQAFGVADVSTGAPMTVDVYQRIGSITKTFTGTVILQLVDEGTIALSDTIDEFVPGIPNGDQVTLGMLLTMTSGLASYTLDDAWQASYFAQPDKVWDPDELVTTARSLAPLFEPGSEYNYSNTNTVLLGKVIEAVTGHPVADEYERRIIGPLGLTGTSFPGASAAFPSPHAQGFTLQSPTATPTAPTNATDWNPSWGWTAGEMISTAPDLLAYGRALVTGQGLLSPALQEERLSSFPANRSVYSYGDALGCIDGWVGHTGELPGYNSAIYVQTDSDTTVAILTNSETLSGDCTVSPTLADNVTGVTCDAPTGRILSAVGAALGHPFTAPAQK